MNYRHAFHAGGFVDVVKHIILALLVEYLKRKDAAFRVIDTHAGIGRYDLTSDEARRSPEWQEGIGRLWESPIAEPAKRLIAPYLDVVRALNPDGLTTYPGSPLLVRSLLRPQDRLTALELHPADADTLAREFAGDIQTRVSKLDGWLALNAYVPPKERRGLVLVDPPFEIPGEFDRLVAGLAAAHRKWATGVYALWYPLKEPTESAAFAEGLRATGIARILRAELTIRRPSTPARLFGTGMIVVNPPYTLAADLSDVLPALADVLAPSGHGGSRVDWLTNEDM